MSHLVVSQGRWLGLDTLALADVQDEGVCLCAWLHGVSLHQLPVIEHTLGECLAGRGCAQGGCESEGLNDGQVRLDVVHGGTWALHLLKHHATLLVQHCRMKTRRQEQQGRQCVVYYLHQAYRLWYEIK
jgi:hypothetical protein